MWVSVKTGTFRRSKVFVLVSAPAGATASARSADTVSASLSATVRVDAACRRSAG